MGQVPDRPCRLSRFRLTVKTNTKTSPRQQAGEFAESGELRAALERYNGPIKLTFEAIDVIVRATCNYCAPRRKLP